MPPSSAPPGWRPLSADTSFEAERVLFDGLRRFGPERKAELISSTARAVHGVVVAGLRARSPAAPRAELDRLAAAQRLGDEGAHLVPCRTEPPRGGDMAEPDPIAVALEITQILEALGVRYVIVGSLASMLHGEPRYTRDVDIVAELDEPAAQKLADELEGRWYYALEGMLRAVRRRDSFNIIHLATMLKVDVFVPPTEPFFEQQLARRISLPIAPPRAAFVASAEDTVLHKLRWYRLGGEVSDQQWRDILGVLKTRGADLDLEYLRRWAKDAALEPLLARALRESGLEPPAGAESGPAPAP